MDQLKNLIKVTLTAGINATDTSIVLSSSDAAKLPDPDNGEYNLLVWNETDFPNAYEDPKAEFVRVIEKTSNTFTIQRPAEGNAYNGEGTTNTARTHNKADKVFAAAIVVSAKLFNDIQTDLDRKADIDHLHDDRYYIKATVDSALALKAAAVHTHALNETVGLVDALAAKAATAHTHTITDVVDLDTELASKAESTHTHDDRYFTETEVTALLTGKAAASHNHNDLYYTESEVDGFLAAKAAASHNHDDLYFTEAEVTALLATKAALNHDHDSDYATPAQVTAAVAGKADASHSHTAANISDFDAEVDANTNVTANTSHRSNTANPHGVTKQQVGLSNVINTLQLVAADVQDVLTSTDADVPLSANQGRVLKGLIDTVNTVLSSDTNALDTLQEVVDFIEANKATLDALAIGSIAGLQAALDAKADLNHTHSQYVQNTGNESIAGNKTFAGDIAMSDSTLVLDKDKGFVLDDYNRNGRNHIWAVSKQYPDFGISYFEGATDDIRFHSSGNPLAPEFRITGFGDGYFGRDMHAVRNAIIGGSVTIADDAFDAADWNGNLTVPTKNAVRDKMELIEAEIAGRAAASHSHAIADVDDLQTTLDGKAAASHTHAQSEITGLTASLAAKANTSHTHAIANITGLDTALGDKANATHTHDIDDTSGLTDALAGKAATSHGHSDATSGAAGFMSATDKAKLDTYVNRITVAAIAPSSPATNDIWIDTN